MATVTTTVHIAAPPSLVRSLFLNFPDIPKWHTGHFSAITVIESEALKVGTKSATSESIGEKLKVDDKIRVSLGGMSFKATVAENTPQRFVWRGGWTYVMIGEHFFQFNDSTVTPGGTTLVHGETFTGGLVSLSKPFLKGDKAQTSPGFEKFNADLKKAAEAEHQRQAASSAKE